MAARESFLISLCLCIGRLPPLAPQSRELVLDSSAVADRLASPQTLGGLRLNGEATEATATGKAPGFHLRDVQRAKRKPHASCSFLHNTDEAPVEHAARVA